VKGLADDDVNDVRSRNTSSIDARFGFVIVIVGSKIGLRRER